MVYIPILHIVIAKIPLKEIGLMFKMTKKSFFLSLFVSITVLVLLTPIAVVWTHGKVPYPTPPFVLLLKLIVLSLVVAFIEEFFFRGYLFYIFNRKLKLSIYVTLFITSFIFAFAHLVYNPNLLYLLTFFPGLVMGWLRIKTDTILGGMIFHFFGNVWAIWFSPLVPFR